MMRSVLPLAVALLVLGVAIVPSREAGAQDPDIRNVRPHVMLLIDTSGSMERKPECICVTPACLECLPICTAPTFEQNRWSIVAQALTGEFSPYECLSEDRIGGIYVGQYDEGYFLPHILLPQELPSFTGTQSGNGILDTYLERIKFGLMTFDSVGTLIDQPPLVPQMIFETAPFPAESAGVKGLYSYGNNAPFSFPGATTTYMINAGARSASAPEGGLVSLGDDSTGSMNAVNAAIQATILGDAGLGKNPLRPFGATPTAALVSDLQFFVQNDPDFIEKTADPGDGDPYFGCRRRSAVLITDGLPNGDMRGSPVFCDSLFPNTVGPAGCPYETIQETVTQMIADGDLETFYVIGFALDGNQTQVDEVVMELNGIAFAGGTTQAFLVANRAELVTALSTILNEQNPGATSRTAPVVTGLSPGLTQSQFISGFRASVDDSDPWDGVLERRRIECEGLLPVVRDVEDSDKFQLVLNAQTAAPAGVEVWSNGMGVSPTGFSRNLWTVLPTVVADANGHVIGRGDARTRIEAIPGIDAPNPSGREVWGADAAAFDASIPHEYFGLDPADDAQRQNIVNWVHGTAGSGREDQRLGDIYHSVPAVVGPRVDDIEDQSYNDWRLGLAHQESPNLSENLSTDGWALNRRPRVIYASTNDGIIHAFLADDYQSGDFSGDLDEFECANGKSAGTELWGFIPPMFLDDLDNLLSGGSKQWFADGNVIVRDLYDVRGFAESDGAGGLGDSAAGTTNVWRTVMFLSFRNGGNGMVALDVTNPCKPEFLWQFTDPDLGDTYGQPTAAQVFLQDGAGGPVAFQQRQARGVIILPGGQGVEDAAASPCAVASGPALPDGMKQANQATISPRSERRCWRGSDSTPPAAPIGRALYVIDLATGSFIRKIDETTFPAPLNGAVSVFRGDTATVGSAAYTVDADGVLWRIDMSRADPDEWSAEALHDIYYDGAYDDAEPTYNPPVLTIDTAGNVVILLGTGNIDVLDDATAKNRVVSITENLDFNSSGLITAVGGRLNWEIVLNDGEQMTGSIELFAGSTFFGTFEASGNNPIDACAIEGSRIYGVDFLDDPLVPGNVVPLLAPNDGGAPTQSFDGNDLPEIADSIVIGVQVAQLPICIELADVSITDPFGNLGTLSMPVNTSGLQFEVLATLSGGGGAAASGLSIDVVNERIAAPEFFTTISGMAETLE